MQKLFKPDPEKCIRVFCSPANALKKHRRAQAFWRCLFCDLGLKLGRLVLVCPFHPAGEARGGHEAPRCLLSMIRAILVPQLLPVTGAQYSHSQPLLPCMTQSATQPKDLRAPITAQTGILLSRMSPKCWIQIIDSIVSWNIFLVWVLLFFFFLMDKGTFFVSERDLPTTSNVRV